MHLSLLPLVITLLSFLQQAAPQKVVPVGEEPRHHVKFENRYVRVIDAMISAGDITLFHTHSRDNVPVAIDGGSLKTVLSTGGPPTESIVEKGRAWWAPAAYTHQITNTGKSAVRFIDVEIISSPGTSAGGPSLAEVAGHSLILENERVRLYRLILQPGQSTGAHKHSASFVTVAVSGGNLQVDSTGKKPEMTAVKPGSFAWLDAPVSHSLKNTGSKPFEAVHIELK